MPEHMDQEIRGQGKRVRVTQKRGLEYVAVHGKERIDVLDYLIEAALGIGRAKIVIDAAEQAPVPVATSYGPNKKTLGLARRSNHEMLGDMHGIVIGREFALVKVVRSRKPKACHLRGEDDDHPSTFFN